MRVVTVTLTLRLREEWVPPGWQLPLEEWHGRHLALEGPGAEALALCVLALSAYASLEAP